MGELKENRKKVMAAKADPPYLFDMYNIKACYGTSEKGLNKFLFPLVDALNEERERHLPKYFLFFLDKDFMFNLSEYKIEAGNCLDPDA